MIKIGLLNEFEVFISVSFFVVKPCINIQYWLSDTDYLFHGLGRRLASLLLLILTTKCFRICWKQVFTVRTNPIAMFNILNNKYQRKLFDLFKTINRIYNINLCWRQLKYMIGFMLAAINICGWSYKCSNSKEKIRETILIWFKMVEVASAFLRHVLG